MQESAAKVPTTKWPSMGWSSRVGGGFGLESTEQAGARLIYFKCLIVALKQKRHGAQKNKREEKEAFKWLPDGRDWGWGLGAGPESDCSGLKRTRGPLRWRKQNDEVASVAGSQDDEGYRDVCTWRKQKSV